MTRVMTSVRMKAVELKPLVEHEKLTHLSALAVLGSELLILTLSIIVAALGSNVSFG